MKYLALLLLIGCPYMGEDKYQSEIRDFDNDGAIAERFGGPDCRDDDPTIQNCDADGDTFRSVAVGGTDCDDNNANIHPDALEQCNEIDDNCDGAIDDADPALTDAPAWFADDDEDGYGDAAEVAYACEVPVHYVEDDRDCDDDNSEIFPGATEFCDEVDRDCDGDPIAGAVDPTDWYADLDGDGFGSGDSIAMACEGPSGSSANNSDCNDDEATAYPGAPETWYDGIDSDCAADSDFDQDGDGFDTPLDCNDTDAAINPDATEVCDGGIDNDCNGVAGNDDPGTSSLGQWIYYLDADGDGEGDDATATPYCPNSGPLGWTLISGDCDDTLDSVNSGGTEVCDDRDNDCDGYIDENAIGMVDFFVDGDGDGYGGTTVQSACDIGPGLSQTGGDCNDADPQTYPGAPELCGDLFRQDCTALSIYDCDSDGFADVASGGTDCDDTRDDVYPGANEICDGIDNNCVDGIDDDDPAVDLSTLEDWFLDDDGDGYGGPLLYLQNACAPVPGAAANSDDCDDNDPLSYPGALELCDGLDNSCDGSVDEDPLLAPPTYYFDADGDGFGNPSLQYSQACDPPGPDWVANGDDCRDDNANVNPLEIEVCDGFDNDCDGDIDMADSSVSATLWYLDDDGDGYGQSTVAIAQCEQPLGYSAAPGDCNDFEPTTNPGATEVCDGGIDNDCDGLGDDADPDLAEAVTWYLDGDNDGYGDPAQSQVQCTQPPGWVNDDSDCDDTQASVSPAAVELCDGLDNDCDDLTDDADPTIVGAPAWFADVDGDAWGDSATIIRACDQPPGFLPSSGDCDDTRPDISPSATEVCDGQDNDCDTFIDDADPDVDATIWYEDADADGYGNPLVSQSQCPSPGAGWLTDASDCDDTNFNIRPGAAEVCNYIDDDCDNRVDDDDPDTTGQTTWYADADADGYGDISTTLTQCGLPPGFVTNSGDCDDTLPQVNPGVPVELCNGFDDNCDGLTDDDDPAVAGAGMYWMDMDGDSFGDPDASAQACSVPPDGVLNDSDCDDTNPSIHPFADEVCDGSGIDENCNGFSNESDPTLTDGSPAYVDLDGDGYSASQGAILFCVAPPAGYASATGDCNDVNPDTYPGATEMCDGQDNDCDLIADNNPNDPFVFLDADGDGFGGPTNGSECPSDTNDFVFGSDDCNDSDPNQNPGASEVCDGIDNDCDTDLDDADASVDAPLWFFDNDFDGFGDPDTTLAVNQCTDPGMQFVSNDSDCDDSSPLTYPGAPESCDGGLDNDCDGLADSDDPNLVGGATYSVDSDGDNWGGGLLAFDSCDPSPPPGFGFGTADCDDTNPNTNQFAVELCDSEDNDCDGSIDEGAADPGVYRDIDLDGYGSGATAAGNCPDGLNGYVFNNTDCDDFNAAINPGAVEVCDAMDNDCDGAADDLDSSVIGQIEWWVDGDLDGYGNSSLAPTLACSPGFGAWTTQAGDCDDDDPDINPSQLEVCDTIDNNCNGLPDDLDPAVTGQLRWYFDSDGDTYGDYAQFVDACINPGSHRLVGGDCDDLNFAISPSATEVCDGIDNNCDGLADDSDPSLDLTSATNYYLDSDGDGYATTSSFLKLCEPLLTQVPQYIPATQNDCNDSDPTIHPNAIEVCDGIDNNCISGADESSALDAVLYYADLDEDGFGDPFNPLGTSCFPLADSVQNSLDCDDGNPAIYLLADEVCDTLDNDCDGLTDNLDPSLLGNLVYYIDGDNDGFGAGSPQQACTLPASNASLVGNDCNDSNSNIFPTTTIDVPSDHTTIQGALDAVCPIDGGATDIYVATDTYFEALTLPPHEIHIIGDSASKPVIVGFVMMDPAQPSGTSLSNLSFPWMGDVIPVVEVLDSTELTLNNIEVSSRPSVAGTTILVSPNAVLNTDSCTFTDNEPTSIDVGPTGIWNSTNDSFIHLTNNGTGAFDVLALGTAMIDGAIFQNTPAGITIGDDPVSIINSSFVADTSQNMETRAILGGNTTGGNTLTIADTEFYNFDFGLDSDMPNQSTYLTRTEFYLNSDPLSSTPTAIRMLSGNEIIASQSIFATWGPAANLHAYGINIDGVSDASLSYNTWVSQVTATGNVSVTNIGTNLSVFGNILYATDGSTVLNASSLGTSSVSLNAFLSPLEQSAWGGDNVGTTIDFISYGNDLPVKLSKPDLHILGPIGVVRDNPASFVVDRDGTAGNLGADGGPEGIGESDYYLDTDADGLLDGWERVFFNNLTPAPTDDPDLDTWTNSVEATTGTDPLSSDTDLDGTPDAADADPLDASIF